jgi:hypothetical protein
MRSPPRRAIVLAAGAAGLAGAGVAVAAALGVSSARLTVHTYASSIPATSCTLNAADADSYVQQQMPWSNFGTAATMHVRSASGSGNRRSFVQLGLGPCSLPTNALIVTASLKLFMHAAPAVSRTYAAHRVTASWTETGITWTNQPVVAGSATATVATGTTSNVTLTLNVTSDVQAFVDGTSNHGWRIADTVENSSTARIAQFRTAEHGTASQRPILEVSYYP